MGTEALNFFVYCAGIGVLCSSLALAVRLVVGRWPSHNERITTKAQWEPMPDPAGDKLVGRLADFQSARFASPIVQRTLREDAGPSMQPRTIPRKGRSFSSPVQSRLSPSRVTSSAPRPLGPGDNVVQLKTKKPETKED
jgi:hypothetical protein